MESLKKTLKIIVTGCNKGIGYGIVEQLCKRKNIPCIIMACRNQGRAMEAQIRLEDDYPMARGKLQLARLDVSDFKSIDAFVADVGKRFGKVHCLVNNAGVMINPKKENEKDARLNAQVNYFGPAYLSKKILSILQNNGKIITVSSQLGKLNLLSKEWQQKLLDKELTGDKLNEYAELYLNSVKEGKHMEKGFTQKWANSYSMSKTFIFCFMRSWAQTEEILKRGIQVYTLCPGYVKTDLTKGRGKRTIEEGCKTPMYLIDLPYKLNKQFQGQFFFNEKVGDLLEPLKF